jgi:hypothetical protein
MPISDRCYHVPTAPGQTMCACLDLIMWTRLLVELQARRIAELEQRVQHGEPWVLNAATATPSRSA